jgi:hypothetical protein
MAITFFTATDITANQSNVDFAIDCSVANITHYTVADISIDELTNPPNAQDLDNFMRIFMRAIWYKAAGTTAQKLAAIKAGASGDTIGIRFHNYATGLDIG